MEKKIPRGIRNNNPGNIKNNEKIDWMGEVPKNAKLDDAFEEFSSIEYGIRAMMILLRNYQLLHGLHSIKEIIGRYAPKRDRNNTPYYVRYVSVHLEVPADAPIDLSDKATMTNVVDSIIFIENGVRVDKEIIEKGWELAKIK